MRGQEIRLAKRSHHHWMQLLLGKALSTWRGYAQQTKANEQRARQGLVRMREIFLHKCWRRWREEAQALGQQARVSTHALQAWRKLELRRGFNTWQYQLHSEQRDRTALRGAVKFRERRAWNLWRHVADELQHEQTILTKAPPPRSACMPAGLPSPLLSGRLSCGTH
jgi:hypothetical protein